MQKNENYPVNMAVIYFLNLIWKGYSDYEIKTFCYGILLFSVRIILKEFKNLKEA